MPYDRAPSPTPAPAPDPQTSEPVSTPPPTALSALHQTERRLTLQHSTSEPELFDLRDSFHSRRNKRKRADSPDEQFTTFMTEMRTAISELKEQQTIKMNCIFAALADIRERTSDIHTSIEFLAQKYEFLSEKFNELKQENAESRNYTKGLEEKIDKLEQMSRSACIEIKNVPVVKSENKEALVKRVQEIGDIIHAPIQPHDVKDAFRISTKDPENKTIIVELTSCITKERIIRMYKKFNKEHSKLSTENLKLSGPPVPLYISENLTPKMKRLFYLARDFAKTNGFTYCWTTNGKIFIREREGSPLKLIKDETDLTKLTKSA